MWLGPRHAHLLTGGKKTGFLVSANPTDHPKHTRDLRTRMPVAEELAKATDAAAAAAGLTDFDLARAAKVARGQGLDPRHALNSFFDDGMAKALIKSTFGGFTTMQMHHRDALQMGCTSGGEGLVAIA